MPKKFTDVLLINLGTPATSSRKSVAAYLKEFLTDPRVINLSNPWRWLFVHGFLAPFRSKQTALAYQKIWQTEGSPLLTHTKNLTHALLQHLGDHYRIKFAMRYGHPNITDSIAQLMTQPAAELIIVPLYPQYASATTGTALDATLQIIKSYTNIPALKVMPPFYDHPIYINTYSKIVNRALQGKDWDFLLFTYHGLPISHIEKSGCRIENCDQNSQCPAVIQNHYCYRQQCFITSRLMAKQMKLSPSQYQVCFQSRLGQLPWIKPYIDQHLPLLFDQGIRNLVLISPSFVCDCLETLEEIGIRLQEQWYQLGGKKFMLIPSLNNHPEWVNALAHMITEI